MGLYGVSIGAMFIATVASMILGSLWYGPIFGKQWIKMMGWSKKDIQKGMSDKSSMYRSYAIALITSLLTALVMGIAVRVSTLYGAYSGACLGALLWLGFVATTSISNVLWEGKPWRLWILNQSYTLLNFMVVGAIMGAWG